MAKKNEPSAFQSHVMDFLREPGQRFIRVWKMNDGAIERIGACGYSQGLEIGFWTISKVTFGIMVDRGYIRQVPYPIPGIEHWIVAGAQAQQEGEA